MTSGATIYRSILIYGICLPVAMFLGYMLALPLDYSSLTFFSLTMGILLIPVFLRWHYPLLVFFWNTTMVLPFVPGRPQAYLAAIAMSFGVAMVTRMLNKRMRFLSVPSVIWPLLFMTAVIFLTARFTGGIGFRVFGGEQMGGKRYFVVFGAILGYFALTSHRIPLEKAALYVALFYLSGITQAVGSFAGFFPSSMYFIFAVFPVEKMPGADFTLDRPFGVAIAALSVYAWMLAHYGIRGVFLSGKPWRLALFVGSIVISLFGGFRSFLILAVMVFAIQFYLEGLFRTRLAMVLAIGGLLGGLAVFPFIRSLPASFQRTVAFLPVEVDTEVKISAEASSNWRLNMWKVAIPTIPDHLLLGTGYSIDPMAYGFATSRYTKRYTEDYRAALMAGDFHNGPLSVVLPLGIWGVIGFVWYLIAGFVVLRRNYLYGDPHLKIINCHLLAAFIAQAIHFCFVFGSLHSEFTIFTSAVGLSVALNGGVSKPAPAPETATQRAPSLATILPRVRPVFGRR